MAPLTLNLDIKRKRVVNLTLRPPPSYEPVIFIQLTSGWAPDEVWTFFWDDWHDIGIKIL